MLLEIFFIYLNKPTRCIGKQSFERTPSCLAVLFRLEIGGSTNHPKKKNTNQHMATVKLVNPIKKNDCLKRKQSILDVQFYNA